MQRPLAVAAFGMDEVRIARNQSRKFLHHAKMGGRANVNPGAADNQGSSCNRIYLFQDAKAAIVPAGPGIEIRAMGKQQIEHVEPTAGDARGRASKAEDRLVDFGHESGMVLQQPAHLIKIARFDRRLEQIQRRFC
jgi:hypothetical protein